MKSVRNLFVLITTVCIIGLIFNHSLLFLYLAAANMVNILIITFGMEANESEQTFKMLRNFVIAEIILGVLLLTITPLGLAGTWVWNGHQYFIWRFIMPH